MDRFNEREGLERKQLIYLDEATKDIEAVPRVPKLEKETGDQIVEMTKKKRPSKELDDFRRMSQDSLYQPPGVRTGVEPVGTDEGVASRKASDSSQMEIARGSCRSE